jgi:cytochrome b involved in lipid metabolism
MVYDMTSFLQIHPGGAHAILQEAGKDVRYAVGSIDSA